MDEIDQKPMVYVDGDITYYRASSLLQCPAAFIHARNHQPQRIPHNLQTAFNEGIEAEPQVIDMLVARGHKITATQLTTTCSFDVGRLQIIGHIDGKIDGELLEIKALSSDNTRKFVYQDWQTNFPYYAWQISAYMWGTMLPAKFAIWDKGEKELHIVSVTNPPIGQTELHDRLRVLEESWKVYQQTDIYPSCTTTTFCPFYHLHKDYSDPEPTTIPLTPNTPLANQVAAYEALSAKISRLEDLRKGIRTELETTLRTLVDTPDIRAEGGGYSVSYIPVSTTRLDQKKVKVELGDRYDNCTTTTTATRLTVKRNS